MKANTKHNDGWKSRDNRLLERERFILDVTETIIALMQQQNMRRKDLANILGVDKSHITQILSGERNMTLKTLSDIGYALKHKFVIK